MKWVSPLTGKALYADTPHSLSTEGGERWPVVDDIPFLRTGREPLVKSSLAALDDGDETAALAMLLADQDPWWTGSAADPQDLHRLVTDRERLSLRDAMALLKFGPVGDYFAYRWVDPTFLAGLALLDAHWRRPATAFELAGGIGHYARNLQGVGTDCVSADIVFAKCWLGKHWVAPEATYVVFDAATRWPIGNARFDLVHCQDAFYFLPDQREVAKRLREAVADDGTLAIGHLHNAGVAGGALGPAKHATDWRHLFPDASAYDECELRAAMLDGRAPLPCDWSDGPDVEAWSVVEPAAVPRAIGALATPRCMAGLRTNPLLIDGQPRWPSPRYEREYAGTATFTDPAATTLPERDRRLVDLPERW